MCVCFYVGVCVRAREGKICARGCVLSFKKYGFVQFYTLSLPASVCLFVFSVSSLLSFYSHLRKMSLIFWLHYLSQPLPLVPLSFSIFPTFYDIHFYISFSFTLFLSRAPFLQDFSCFWRVITSSQEFLLYSLFHCSHLLSPNMMSNTILWYAHKYMSCLPYTAAYHTNKTIHGYSARL